MISSLFECYAQRLDHHRSLDAASLHSFSLSLSLWADTAHTVQRHGPTGCGKLRSNRPLDRSCVRPEEASLEKLHRTGSGVTITGGKIGVAH